MQRASFPWPNENQSSHKCKSTFWQFYRDVELLLVLVIYWSNCIVCQGALSFLSQPRNQTVKEGEAVRFECSYEGSYLTPAWRINSTIYSHTELPHIFMYNDQDFSLTVGSVQSSLNFTSFECIVGTVFSNRGYLHVEKVDQEKLDITDRLQVTTSLSEWRTSDSSVSTAVSRMLSTVNNHDVSHSLSISVPVLISVPVVVSITLSFCVCILGIGTFWMSSKTKPMSEACEHDVEVGDNEAYAAVEKYREPIKVNNNPAYETILNLPSKHERCKSPQA